MLAVTHFLKHTSVRLCTAARTLDILVTMRIEENKNSLRVFGEAWAVFITFLNFHLLHLIVHQLLEVAFIGIGHVAYSSHVILN